MFELRWIVRSGWDGPEKLLQYRTQVQRTRYDTVASNGSRITTMEWTDWQYVPTVDDTKSSDNT